MRRLPARLSDDSGSSQISMAIIFPFVILLTITLIQGIMWAYARNIAYTAARAGVSAGRMYEASPQAGATKANRALDELAGNMLTGRHVSTDGSSTQTMRIRVEGGAMSMIPGVPRFPVSATVSGPIERWTTAGGNQ